MKARGLAFFYVVLLSIVLVQPVSASMQLEYRSRKIDLKPEYDNSEVLVVYDGFLVNKSDKTFNGEIEVLVPGDAKVGSVCKINEQGDHNCQLYKTEEKGNYKLIKWDSKGIKPGEEYHTYLEFYSNPLKGEVDKELSFRYRSTYFINNLNLRVFKPLEATNFSSEPEADKKFKSRRGLEVFKYNLGQLDSGRTVDLEFGYTKSNPKPSMAIARANKTRGGASSGGSQSERTAIDADLGLIVIFGVFVVILITILFYGTRQSSADQSSKTAGRSDGKTADLEKLERDTSEELTPAEERKKARQLLLNNKISESTYRHLMDEMEN